MHCRYMLDWRLQIWWHDIQPHAQEQDVEKFLTDCKNFLCRMCSTNSTAFRSASKIPWNCHVSPTMQRCSSHTKVSWTLYQELLYLKNVLDIKKLDMGWRSRHSRNRLLQLWSGMTAGKWSCQLATGKGKHPNLMKLVSASLPFANAAVERVFSQLKLIKSDRIWP